MKQSKKVARQILTYLREHPQASDTLEGIAKWWMQNQTLNESLNLIKQALAELETEGEVSERKMSDGRTIYAARRES
ncbi:MAG TPA: hypothetical protein VF297_02470 [Pyrinomonadaceae bacterium]